MAKLSIVNETAPLPQRHSIGSMKYTFVTFSLFTNAYFADECLTQVAKLSIVNETFFDKSNHSTNYILS